MEKSADAFRTISEVAEDLALPQHVLRFWETRFPQVRPLKRAGGRRYYRPADVLLLRAIRQLLYDDGYTIKGVQRLLKEQGAKELGAGLRPTEPDRVLMPEALVDFEDEPDEVPEAEVLALADVDDVPAVAAPLSRRDARNLIEEALATVEECKRILDAVLRPTR